MKVADRKRSDVTLLRGGRHHYGYVWAHGTHYALIAGKVPRTFWRTPLNGKDWTADMVYGLGVVDGVIVPVLADEPGEPWGGER